MKLVCPRCKNIVNDANYGEKCPNDGTFLVDEASYTEMQGDPLIGTLVGDEFGLVGLLGSGGFGSVYRGIQFPIGRMVALKILHGHASRQESVRRRFLREAQALAQLSDPSIVQFIRFGEVMAGAKLGNAGMFFIAQEYIDGEVLSHIIKNQAPLPWPRVRFLTRSILKALAAAHKKNITHRDLKPSNIMVCEDAFQGDLVKVLDFGIAKFRSDRDEDEQTLTGTLLGTPNYMSPEQIRNEAVGPATDLYAVGILMYEMLTGKRPFARDAKIDVLRAHLDGQLPDLDVLPKSAREVVRKALSRHPQDRYSTARAMAEAIDQQDSLGSFTSDGGIVELQGLEVSKTGSDTFVESTVVDADPLHFAPTKSLPPSPELGDESMDESAGEFRSGPISKWLPSLALVCLGVLIGILVWWGIQDGQNLGASPGKPVASPSTGPQPPLPQNLSTKDQFIEGSAIRDAGKGRTPTSTLPAEPYPRQLKPERANQELRKAIPSSSENRSRPKRTNRKPSQSLDTKKRPRPASSNTQKPTGVRSTKPKPVPKANVIIDEL